MALEKKKISEIPPDAVILTEDEAYSYQSKILNNWKDSADIFAYKYGSFLLAGATAFSGIYINNHFRRKLKLMHYGRMTSYLPVCVIPSTLSILFHQGFVLKELVLLKKEQCPVCIEVRASVAQSFTGFVLPLMISPISCLTLANRYNTFNMPYITKEPRKVYEVLKTQLRPIKNILFAILIGHALLSSVVTYFEAESIYKVGFKLMQLEKELIEEGKI